MCLDVLRAMHREKAAIPAILSELDGARGSNRHLDAAIDVLKGELANSNDMEQRARALTERMAITLQAALLVQYAPASTSDAFCDARLNARCSNTYGTLSPKTNFEEIIHRAWGENY